MPIDPYDDEFDPDYEEIDQELLKKHYYNQKKAAQKAARANKMGEVGVPKILTPEDYELRARYEKDYIAAHMEIFTETTGIKPFGPVQEESVKRTQHTIFHGGKTVIVEPRGFGKTTRTANNCLLAVLQGKVKYALVLASSVDKARDILDIIKSELIDNEKLFELYPQVCACFRHLDGNPIRGRSQTVGGKPTYANMTKELVRFPVLKGEPSSGAVIRVRTKDNVRGLNAKIRDNEGAGTVVRPEFVFMDDIQTDEEAASPTTVYKIVQSIKKSVLFGGSHARRVSVVMCATPICPGDVVSHFVLNEPAWDVVLSKMVIRMPKNLDMWLGPYARILLDFDRHVTGDSTRAALKAKQFVIDHYDELHEGAEVGWEWAYGWGEEPQTEVSALQHAMNFLIMNGEDAFESECQCIIVPKTEEAEGIKATVDEIVNKVHPHPRKKMPVEAKYIVSHIDVNKDILTYVTVASEKNAKPHIIDYGTWPKQPGATWKKSAVFESLARNYPDVPEEHERLYVGIKDLINYLGGQKYIRDDGQEMHHNLIAVDMSWRIDEVQRAIRDSDFRHITMCYRGQGIEAKDKPFMERHYEKHAEKHFHCATVPTTDRTLTVLYTDVNYFKSLVHKGFKSRYGITGSLSLFQAERESEHILFAQHCVSESPEETVNEKDKRTVIAWRDGNTDNEYFDNVVGCYAMLFKLGCELRQQKKQSAQTYSIQEFIESQKQ
ncbi:MAG: hypothetical protein KatS3mg087_1391 [Patescibacteria group bacterium]|nr:MAG: hypothetical protein KatS3mg087_1391 [Patescibacteria group bacterium]